MDERLGTFTDEADAFAQCEAAGYTAHKYDFPAEDNDFHWHDFDSLTFITSKSFILTILSDKLRLFFLISLKKFQAKTIITLFLFLTSDFVLIGI